MPLDSRFADEIPMYPYINMPSFAISDPMSPFAIAETIVFWDVEDCPIPDGLKVCDVCDNIELVLRRNGYRGDITIRPHVDFSKMEDDLDEGVDIFDIFDGLTVFSVDSGDREAKHEQIIWDLINSTRGTKFERLNLMLIVGDISENDELFSVCCSFEARYQYSVTLAHPPKLTVEGLMEGLSLGEELITRHCGERLI